VSTARQKRGIFGLQPAKARRWSPCSGAQVFTSVGEIVLESMAPVPAEGIGVMSLLAENGRTPQVSRLAALDHDFVIESSIRNKLKDRPN
jgi:hypothetical protein